MWLFGVLLVWLSVSGVCPCACLCVVMCLCVAQMCVCVCVVVVVVRAGCVVVYVCSSGCCCVLCGLWVWVVPARACVSPCGCVCVWGVSSCDVV